VEDVAYVGGGSLPDQSMKSWVIEIESASLSDDELARRLRTGNPAVMVRLRGGKLLLDVRTIFAHQGEQLIEAVRNALTT
jgi:L-seryl-tRNA(Ser) seleniumtransferase